MLGEHDTRTNPDCPDGPGPCFPKKITIKVAEIIKHNSYGGQAPNVTNDIALIRLSEPVPLSKDNPTKSSVAPICLPWSEKDTAR